MKRFFVFLLLFLFTSIASTFTALASDEYSGYIVTFKENFPTAALTHSVSLMSTDCNEEKISEIHRDERLFKIEDEETLQPSQRYL